MNSIDPNILVNEYQGEINRLTKDVIVLRTMLKQANAKIEELSNQENKDEEK